MLHQTFSAYCSSSPRWLAVQQHFGLRCSLYYSKLLQIGTSNLWLDSSSHASLCPGQSLYSSKKFSRLSCCTIIFSSVTSKKKIEPFSHWAVCVWIHCVIAYGSRLVLVLISGWIWRRAPLCIMKSCTDLKDLKKKKKVVWLILLNYSCLLWPSVLNRFTWPVVRSALLKLMVKLESLQSVEMETKPKMILKIGYRVSFHHGAVRARILSKGDRWCRCKQERWYRSYTTLTLAD